MLHTGSKISRTRRLQKKSVTSTSYARRQCSPEGRYENVSFPKTCNLSWLRPKAKCSPKAVPEGTKLVTLNGYTRRHNVARRPF